MESFFFVPYFVMTGLIHNKEVMLGSGVMLEKQRHYLQK